MRDGPTNHESHRLPTSDVPSGADRGAPAVQDGVDATETALIGVRRTGGRKLGRVISRPDARRLPLDRAAPIAIEEVIRPGELRPRPCELARDARALLPPLVARPRSFRLMPGGRGGRGRFPSLMGSLLCCRAEGDARWTI
jgi:hypothetical protein